MAIEFACQDCGTRYRRPDEDAGKAARCTCGAMVRVPTLEAVASRNATAVRARQHESKSVAVPVALIVAGCIACVVSFYAGTQVGSQPQYVVERESSVVGSETVPKTRWGDPPAGHTPGVRPALHVVWERLEHDFRANWHLTDVLEPFDDPLIDNDDLNDGELQVTMAGSPILLGISGPRSAVKDITVIAGPLETDTLTEHPTVGLGAQSLAAAAGVSASEVLGWLRSNQSALNAGAGAEPRQADGFHVWGRSLQDDEGLTLYATISIDEAENPTPPHGVAKIEHSFADSPFWPVSGASYRHEAGVQVEFDADNRGKYMRITYDPKDEEQRDMFSTALVLLPGIAGNEDEDYLINSQRISAWGEKPLETLKLRGGSARLDTLEDRYLVLTVREE